MTKGLPHCPFCKVELVDIHSDTEPYHYQCPECDHKWYFSDLYAFAGMALAGFEQKALDIIRKKDKEIELKGENDGS